MLITQECWTFFCRRVGGLKYRKINLWIRLFAFLFFFVVVGIWEKWTLTALFSKNVCSPFQQFWSVNKYLKWIFIAEQTTDEFCIWVLLTHSFRLFAFPLQLQLQLCFVTEMGPTNKRNQYTLYTQHKWLNKAKIYFKAVFRFYFRFHLS